MANALPDDAWVVRGGTTTPEQLEAGVTEHERVPGLHGFSVQSAPGVSIEVLARAGRLPNRKVSVCRAGDLRAAGFNVVPSPGAGHHATVITPEPLPEDVARLISGIFRQQPNPAREV